MQNFGNRCAEFSWKFCTPHFLVVSRGKFHTWLCRIFEKTGADFWWKLCTSHFGVISLGFVHTWLLRSWRGGVQPLDRESAQHVFENFMTFFTRQDARTVSGTHGKKRNTRTTRSQRHCIVNGTSAGLVLFVRTLYVPLRALRQLLCESVSLTSAPRKLND